MSFRNLWILRFPTSYFRSSESQNWLSLFIWFIWFNWYHKSNKCPNQSLISKGYFIPIGTGLDRYPESRFWEKKIYSFFIELWILKIKYRHDRPSRLPLLLAGQEFVELDQQNKKFQVFCWSGDTRIWTGDKGFAVPRLTTWPCRQIWSKMDNIFIHPYSITNFFILNPIVLIPFQKWIPIFYWIQFRLFSSIDCISKDTLLKNFPSPSIEKRKNRFPVTDRKIQGKLEPLTIFTLELVNGS